MPAVGHNGKLKLDLHTHCLEALAIFKEADVTKEVVGKIVSAVTKAGLDGIAITEHDGIGCAQKIKDLVEQYYDNKILIFIGEEVPYYPVHVVQFFLSDNTVFRFLAHPGSPADFTGFLSHNHTHIHGIELRNHVYNWNIDRQMVEEASRRYDLLLLRGSDAHNLKDIGQEYTEINLEQLEARANVSSPLSSALHWVFDLEQRI